LTTIDINDRLTLDAGLRVENHKVSYAVDEGLDGSSNLVIDESETAASYTAGVNYSLNDTMGVFFRLNQGHKMPYFDNYRENQGQFASGNDLLVEVQQYELGYKLSNDLADLFVTGFHTKVDPAVFVAISGVTQAQSFTNESTGVEIDSNLYLGNFSLNVNATLQESTIKGGVNDGNDSQRQPAWQFRLAPSYNFSIGGNSMALYGALSVVDDRYGDNENTVTLEGYEKVDLGAIVNFDNGMKLQLAAENITDEQGVTEGDPRNAGAPNGRYIMPRNVKLSLAYQF
jgi:outer membrane receptor protein involved in Fe transport